MSMEPKYEPEHEGPIWKHPYMIYILLTGVLFTGLMIMGWLAYTNGWIPNRGISD